MASDLLERGAVLDALESALSGARTGTGSVVLVGGEAGVGKTSVVRAFRRRVAGHARVLVGACDDLLTPRALGPLHDVVAAHPDGPLATALQGGRDAALSGVHRELAAPGDPTVLVVEDAHWADEATLDVLRWTGRRIADLPAVLLVTYRDTEVGPALRRVLGDLNDPWVHRVALRPLSREAVARWAGGTPASTSTLYAMTAGNPFFVSEVLAGDEPGDGPVEGAGPGSGPGVPGTVVDAVLSRVRRLGAATQRQLEQVAVVPSQVEMPLARALLGDLDPLVEAERRGILEVRARAVAFRHELARRAVEDGLAATERIRLNERVVAALLDGPDPDPARVVHHAVQAGDDATVVAHAPEAARRATVAGAQLQAAGHHEQTLRRAALLTDEQHAAVAEAYAWTLYHGDRPREGAAAGATAVALRERLGGVRPLARALASVSVLQWAALRVDDAQASGERAVRLLDGDGDSAERVYALTFLGTLLVNVDEEDDALARLDEARATAARLGWRDLDAIGDVFRGRAVLQLGDGAGLAECDRGIALARAAGDHQGVMIGYLNTICGLWMLGRFGPLLRYLDEGAAYGRDREFHTLDLNRELFRHKLQALHGDWDRAAAGFRRMMSDDHAVSGGADASDGGHGLDRYGRPELARLAARRGDPAAAALLTVARPITDLARNSFASVTTTLAELELAWATEDPGRTAAAVGRARTLLPALERRGHQRNRGEVLRWLRRVGEPAAAFDGCPEEFAAGLRGDWRAATAACDRLGAPYERALELAGSGDVDATTEALEVLDRLGAAPAAARARRRLRELGARRIPRGPNAATRAHDAGLTERQAEILRLVEAGWTNAEIAEELVLSVRTVDHHVSVVLRKLGVSSRREVARAVAQRRSRP